MGCPSGKNRFSTERGAQLALLDALIAKNRGKNQRREVRWYPCGICHGFHLTSKPKA